MITIRWRGRRSINGYAESFLYEPTMSLMVRWIGYLYDLHADSPLDGLVID